MYTIQFEGGAPLKLPNKKALKVALKLYNMLRGEYTKYPHPTKPGEMPGIYGASIGFYPYFPKSYKTPKGYFHLFEVYVNTPFLTEALKGYELNAFEFKYETGRELVRLTPEEEALAYKLFGHPLEEEYKREYAIYETRTNKYGNAHNLYDLENGLKYYDDIPLILWNYSNTIVLMKKEGGEDYPFSKTPYYGVFGDKSPEDAVKELLAKINKK